MTQGRGPERTQTTANMNQKYEKLKGLLKELFQLDQPDLDFGLYRIMHAKSAEVTQFLDKDLLPQVKEAFGLYKTADKAELEKELAKALEQAASLGADADTLPKVKELRGKLANDAIDLGALENEVYDHLFTFFRRYYSDGDFLAKRVYKPNVYAVPYEGEELTLHWANKDQYYIKTGEYLRDYAFCLRPYDDKNPMRVHFRLADAAEGEHGNVKATEGKDRVFILLSVGHSGRECVSLADGEQGKELNIRFEYRESTLTDWPDSLREGKAKPPTQKDLIAFAKDQVLAIADASTSPWIGELSKPAATEKEPSRTVLQKHLKKYVDTNQFDYFIHKDLRVFLRRELDFYIKNELLFLDDLDHEAGSRVEQYLSKVKVVRSISSKIIDFLAQLEDFQKRLWLKKKFVLETNYCVTLDRIPEELYPEIAANDAQRKEWVQLYAISDIEADLNRPGYSVPLTIEFLKAHPTLVVDTCLFSRDFVARFLSTLSDLDQDTDGLLVHSENFQALGLMSRKLAGLVDFVYIDPPYNTDATEIAYKNGYKDSSWLALIADRMELGRLLLCPEGVHCLTIDDYEHAKVRLLLDATFSTDNYLATVLIRNNPSGRSTVKGFSVNHEFALFYGVEPGHTRVGRMPHNEDQRNRYDDQDDDGAFEWENFRKSSAGSDRASRPKQFFPLYVCTTSLAIRVPKVEWIEASKSYIVLEEPNADETDVWPLDETGTEKVWRWGLKRTCSDIDTLIAKKPDNRIEVYGKKYLNVKGILPRTWWDKSEYSARDNGTRTLRELFPGEVNFDFPKAVDAVKDCVRIGCPSGEGVVLDYFGGSATTGHAVIELNRDTDSQRKFILVEMGQHFDTVVLPRIKKVIYSPEWKDGKPKRPATSEEAERGPHVVKVLRLETYEDSLNNLEVRRTREQQSLLDNPAAFGANGFREQYILRYMLDIEARGSQSLLNVQAFSDPTAYRLRVKKPGSDESREVEVDLLETFNWLLGLTVHSIAVPQSFEAIFERDGEKRLQLKSRIKEVASGPWWFRIVEGATRECLKTLIVWRKLTGDLEQDNLVLDAWMKDRLKISTKDFEFDLIYVNGDNNLENLKLPDDTWKVRLIEEDFHRLMFEREST